MLRKHLPSLILGVALSLAALTPTFAGPVAGGGTQEFRPSFFDIFTSEDSAMAQALEKMRHDAASAEGADAEALLAAAEDTEDIIVFIVGLAQGSGDPIPTESLSLNFTSSKQEKLLKQRFGASITQDELMAFTPTVIEFLSAYAANHGASEETLDLLGEVRGFFAYGTLKY